MPTRARQTRYRGTGTGWTENVQRRCPHDTMLPGWSGTKSLSATPHERAAACREEHDRI